MSGSEHKMPEPVAWIVSEQNQIGSTSDYLRWHRGRAPKSVGKAAEALYSAETVDALLAEVERLREERDRLAATDAGAALGLLVRMRFACGDNGKRMQDELEDYLRGLAKDAGRYRWLRDGGLYRVGFDSTGGVSLSVLDSAIDAAMSEEER